MSQRVVFLDRQSLRADLRRPASASSYVEYAATAPTEIVARLLDATVAITNKVQLREADLVRLPHLRMIAIAATGYDIIDVGYCTAHGIAVSNIRNYAVHAVPEHVFALILALRRGLPAYRAGVEAGLWQQSPQFCFLTHEIGDLYGSTLGIVGAGTLGRKVAQIAAAFGMRAVFAEHKGRPAPDLEFLPLARLLPVCDVLSLHCPLTSESRNMIGERELRAMKPTALLINTARGGLVDEPALARAIRENWIGGAGVDVLTMEPPREGNPLLEVRAPNFILTPHVAWASAVDAAARRSAGRQYRPLGRGPATEPRQLSTFSAPARRALAQADERAIGRKRRASHCIDVVRRQVAAHPRGPLLAKLLQRLGQRAHIADRDEPARIAPEYLARPLAHRRQHRRPGIKRLEHDPAQGFAARRTDEQVERLVAILDVLAKAGEVHSAAGELFQVRSFTALADEHQACRSSPAAR